ncbi:MAG: hypothetical protein Q8K70_04830 [Bacteroidota bacterium]|nr:hypothetical protein [Bacteroidota bacterium]
MNKSLIFKLLFTFSFMVLYYLIGQYVLMPLFINDEYYYHFHKVPWYIELLFDFQESHPVPTILGYFVFGAIGFYIGKLVAKGSVITTEI